MRYLIHLFIVPASVSFAVWLLLLVALRIQLPVSDRGWAIAAVLAIPFSICFFSQLNRIDLLHRIERLEKQIDKVGGGPNPASARSVAPIK